ncbi:MAG TPA: hypothetical protein PKC13_26970, partial [Blastocatellia bacterium]|nr:hypothetical protein [Blastocatellia bacterium]
MMKLFASDRRSRFVVSLILFLALFVFLSPRHPRAQDSPLTGAKIHRYQSSADSPSAAGEEDGYVIVNTPDGVTCRQVTREEAAQLSFGKARTDLRPLPENRLNAQQQQGLKITLRSTSQLDQFPQAKQVFQRAAARWESIIQSPITVVIDVDFGPTIFGTPFPASNIIGATDPQRLGVADSYAPLRATLIARAQNAQQAEIFNLLPAGNL